MDEATLKTAAAALEQWGVIGALVVTFLAIIFAAYKIAIRWMDKQAVVPREDSGRSSDTPGLKTLFSMRASEVKEETKRAKEDIQDRLDRMETDIRKDFTRLEVRVDEAFRVMGSHREEKLVKLDKLGEKLDDLVRENNRQDRDMMGLSSRISTIEGVMRGASTKSGATQYVTHTPKTDK